MSWEDYATELTGVPAIDEEIERIRTINGSDQESDAESDEHAWRRLLRPGGAFILDQPPEPPALWGRGESVLLADGEALVIAGVQGTGKTTLVQQLALGRAGFDEYADLLGYPITPGARRVLYLAMDRPRQAARSFRRMVGDAWRGELDDKLIIWPGPPPLDLAKHTGLLARLCEYADADTCIVDSLKDAALGLTDDEVGAGWNRARQTALAAGVQLVELHHLRKLGKDHSKLTIDDLYGSTWITAGAGSVLLLGGAPGDPVVSLRHLKQPVSEVGPVQVHHDQDTGRSTIWHETDLVALAGTGDGLTTTAAARALFSTDKPTDSDKAKARRRLERLAREGLLVVVDEGDPAANRPRVWGPK